MPPPHTQKKWHYECLHKLWMLNFSQTKITILLLKCHVCALVQIKWHQPDFCDTGLKAKVCLGLYVYQTETDKTKQASSKWSFTCFSTSSVIFLILLLQSSVSRSSCLSMNSSLSSLSSFISKQWILNNTKNSIINIHSSLCTVGYPSNIKLQVLFNKADLRPSA